MVRLLSVLFTLISLSSFAQLEILPTKKNRNSARILGDTSLTYRTLLPFFDDFSQSDGNPSGLQIFDGDTFALWDLQNSRGVFVGATRSVVPPTYRAATFDGLDSNGQPYRKDGTRDIADILMSCPIDLSNADPATTFISFFWQAGGNVEIPEQSDSLFLEISFDETFNPDSTVRLWQMTGGEDLPGKDSFRLVPPIQIPSQYFRDSVRFRFYAFGDTDGPFDAWHIDWIYLNDGRNKADTLFGDRAWTNQLVSPLHPFKSIPADLFRSDPNRFLRNQQIFFSNLGRLDQVTYVNSLESVVNDQLLFQSQPTVVQVLDSFPKLQFRVDLEVGDVDANLLNQDSSIILRSKVVRIGTDPDLLSPSTGKTISLELNDSISDTYLLDNYFAYDDGTAEFAAGSNRNGAKVAVKYWLETPDTLTHVDFYFPNIDPFSDGVFLTLNILSELDDDNITGIIRTQPITVITDTAINAFTRYKLNNQVILSDTFYIGYQQSTVNGRFVGIGLDRSNPEASQYIFENFEGKWVKNNRVIGALMIRPVFGKADSSIVLSSQYLMNEVIVYPNPSRGSISVNGDYDLLEIFDLSGNLMLRETKKPVHILRVNKGLYLVRLHSKNKVSDRKLIID